MFGRQSKKHSVIVTIGFNDVFEQNYCNFNIVFAVSKNPEFQRLMKEIYQPILKIYLLQCGLTADL